jgi:flagellar biosynthetic protein FliS
MRAHQAYQQQKTTFQPRIDIILALYRKALEHMRQARAALAANNADAARPYLVKAQLIVNALASGTAGGGDELALNFLRLYEFVTDRIHRGQADDIEAAEKILQTLREAFEAARNQAIFLESSGALPAFGEQHAIQLTT